MPNIGEFAAWLVGLIAGAVGDSSMRLGPVPTIALLLVPLVLLSLVARPRARWTGRDLGRLSAVSHAMARAAESGATAIFSLGTAGIVRASGALDRLQTLAALPVLAHVARAAARAGVPLRVTSNDPVATALAAGVLAQAHLRTATPERAVNSSAEYIGEGRPLAAASALADDGDFGVAVVAGSLAEEATLVFGGIAAPSSWGIGATAALSQAASPLLESDGVLIGPEIFQAPADLGGSHDSRLVVSAANRLLWTAIAVILVASLLVAAGAPDPASFLTRR
jgi:hypothetical protein